MNKNFASSQSLEIAPKAESLQEKGFEQKILKHAKDNFSLDFNEVAVTAITVTDLPAGVKSYYLEKKGSYGNQYYNYYVYDDNLFCSEIDDDFEKLLKELNFLAEKKLTVVQFWNLFQPLKLRYKSAILIDQALLAKPYNVLKPVANQLAPPNLEYSNDRAIFTFFIFDNERETVRRYTANISSDYEVEINHSDLKLR